MVGDHRKSMIYAISNLRRNGANRDVCPYGRRHKRELARLRQAFLATRHDDGNTEVDPLTFFFVKPFYVASEMLKSVGRTTGRGCEKEIDGR